MALGADAWYARQYHHDEPSYQAHWLDAQKKTLGASERREEERIQWREQMKQVDAKRLVIVDESGSNIALTPLYARAHEALQEAIGQALETVTAADALGWFTHCGYQPALASNL